MRVHEARFPPSGLSPRLVWTQQPRPYPVAAVRAYYQSCATETASASKLAAGFPHLGPFPALVAVVFHVGAAKGDEGEENEK